MGERLVEAGLTILMGVIGLAMLATLVGQHAQTSGVISAGAQGLAQDIQAAEAPVL